MPEKMKKRPLFDPPIVRRAVSDAFLKLVPRKVAKNPVMFVVEVGSVVTTILLFVGRHEFAFNLQITLWLWFTVLFANFAEAMEEGRGKAQADTLRAAKSETLAKRLLPGGTTESVASAKLRSGDVVVIAAGEFDHHEDAARLGRGRRARFREERRAAETGGAQNDAAEARAQKVAPCDAADARENRHGRLQKIERQPPCLSRAGIPVCS